MEDEEMEYLIHLVIFDPEEKGEGQILVSFLRERLPGHIKFVVHDESDYWDAIADCGDLFFIVIDATKPRHDTLINAAHRFYNMEYNDQGSKPCVIITNADVKGAKTESAENFFPNFWGNMDPSQSDADLFFSTFYFSYRKRKFDIDPSFTIEGDGVDLIVERVECNWLLS